MLWYLPWSENIKKRACRYLLQRYLGNFLEEKLTLDQLSVDLFNGTGTVSDVSLDCEALNVLGDQQNWPLEIVDGYMKEITVSIPWSTILKDDSVVEVNGLSLTVQPKVRPEPVSSMLESMWSSMSSSMQLAAECLREEDGPQEVNPVEGIEMFAHAIDSILSRVKVRFINTKIRIEHVPKNSDKGIALEIHIKHIDYFDEAGLEPPPEVTDPDKPKTYIVSTYTNKRILFDGITLYTDEFPSKLRTMARSLIMERSASSQPEKNLDTSELVSQSNYQSTMSDVFYETKSTTGSPDSETNSSIIKEVLECTTTQENDVKRDVTPDDKANQLEPILFAKLIGRQELVLKMKHSEEAAGPKVEVYLSMGSLAVFLSPRQLQTLLELVDGLSQPDLEDRSNIPLRATGINMQCKPMRPADFQLIEAQLMGNFSNDNARPNLAMYGWTGHSFDDSDTETGRFQPMGAGAGVGVGGSTGAGGMADSFSSTVSSVSCSAASSVMLPHAQPRLKRNAKVPQIDGDPTAEVSHINITMTSCSCVLLHKDILAPMSLGSECVSWASVKTMQEASTEFFNNISYYPHTGQERIDFDKANDCIDRATRRNHLRLMTCALGVEGSEKTTSAGRQMSCEATLSHLMLRECLYNEDEDTPQSFDLLRFQFREEDDKESETASTSAGQPAVRVNFKQTLKYMRVGGEKKLLNPTTDITIICQPLFVDIELTLLERVKFRPRDSEGAHAQNQFNLAVHIADLDAVLRFPIVDFRPGVKRDGRRVRPDYILIKLADVLVNCQQVASPKPLATTVTVSASDIDLYYHENESFPAVHIAKANVDGSSETARDILKDVTPGLPTITLTFQPKKLPSGPFDPLSDEECTFEPPAANPMTTSMYIMDKIRDNSNPSPFSSKKTAHQTTTKHQDSPQAEVEELVITGSEEEMAEFTSHSVEQSAIHLALNLPILSLQLESKQLYEIVYNRINSDLLLWEPCSESEFDISAPEPSIYPAFAMCHTPGYDSDSASTSSEDDNIFYSTYEQKTKLKKVSAKPATSDSRLPHNFCLTLKVGKGLLTVYTPVRDSNKRVVPGQMGELVLEAQKLSLCTVSGLRQKAKTAQMCLRVAKTTLYHEAVQTIPSTKPSLRLYGTSLPSHLKETIYPSGNGVRLKSDPPGHMLTMALNVEPHAQHTNFKRICLALGIDGGTLRHRGVTGISWLTQLLDVLDVIDYPVPGYRPSIVMTELHATVSNCAVDYRPLYLPIRSIITLGSFSVSSNVLAQTNTSSLRFLLQEVALFVANVPEGSDESRPDLARYVCVCDVPLFQLSLRTPADKSSENHDPSSGPELDLSACNNSVNIRTCWDSASALCRLVTYVARDGDTCQSNDTQHIGFDEHQEEIRELSPSEIQQVNDLMAEAMKESPDTTLNDDETNTSNEKEGVEIFFFPDESNVKKLRTLSLDTTETDDPSGEYQEALTTTTESNDDGKPTITQVAKELGDPNASPKVTPKKPERVKTKSGGSGSNTDDEFCIIESACEDDDVAEPTVKWFGKGPVPLLDNHFTVPAAKSDVLKAPDNFPQPLTRYTLCEMTIHWCMFGGNDFKQVEDSPPKRVTIDAPRSPNSPKCTIDYESHSSRRAAKVSYRSAGAGGAGAGAGGTTRSARRDERRDSALQRGGANRDNDTQVQLLLSKVKFQHESYGGGAYASRQTLAVSKIEVLDRVERSHINKLLSHYLMPDEPQRNNAHMLVIKAVQIRGSPGESARECCLKVSLLPLRLNVDQDTLAFLVGFFSKLGSDEAEEESDKSLSTGSVESGTSRQNTPTHRPPVMSVARKTPPTDTASLNEEEPLMESYEAERMVSENLIQLEEEFQLGRSRSRTVSQQTVDPEPNDQEPMYFRRVVFSPEVPIRLDYVGKRVDLSAGPIAGLLMGLGQLNCSELKLKRLCYRQGVLGLERLIRWALQEWLSDMKRHQLPGLLGGIGPMHSLLQFVRGVRDLVWLPLEQWRRDGRLVHGLRRGAASFTARSAVAALDLAARLATALQALAETAFDMLTPGPTLQLQAAYCRRERRRRRRRHPAAAPADLRAGVAAACSRLREGFAETATTMAIAARSERSVGVLRQLPGAAVAPLALAAAGAADLLGGVRAHLAPRHAADCRDKWRPRPDSPTSE